MLDIKTVYIIFWRSFLCYSILDSPCLTCDRHQRSMKWFQTEIYKFDDQDYITSYAEVQHRTLWRLAEEVCAVVNNKIRRKTITFAGKSYNIWLEDNHVKVSFSFPTALFFDGFDRPYKLIRKEDYAHFMFVSFAQNEIIEFNEKDWRQRRSPFVASRRGTPYSMLIKRSALLELEKTREILPRRLPFSPVLVGAC